jgi:hypothetical protein
MTDRHYERVCDLAHEVAMRVRSGRGPQLQEAAANPSSVYLASYSDWSSLLARVIEDAIREHAAVVRREHLYEYATTTAATGEAFEPPGGGGWEYLAIAPLGPGRKLDGSVVGDGYDYVAIAWRRPIVLPERR